MPDISMCRNQDCVVRLTCHRFTARASDEWQAYGDFIPEEHPGITEGSCSYYWKMTKDQEEEYERRSEETR